jgi:hypothetical protein
MTEKVSPVRSSVVELVDEVWFEFGEGHFEQGRWIPHRSPFDQFVEAVRNAGQSAVRGVQTIADSVVNCYVDGERLPGVFYRGMWIPRRDSIGVGLVAEAILTRARAGDPDCARAVREIRVQIELEQRAILRAIAATLAEA